MTTSSIKIILFMGMTCSFFKSNSVYACSSTMNSLQQSKYYIEFILSDVVSSSKQLGGGGISEIKKISNSSYRVSVPQGEKIDEITYDLDMSSLCALKIKKRTIISKPARG